MSSSSSIPFIPLDMWPDILVCLPAESLIRARAVCKGWLSLINDPRFVRAHTNKHRQQLPFICQTTGRRSCLCYSLDFEALVNNFSNGYQAIAATPLDPDFLGDNLLEDVSACNGLILARDPHPYSPAFRLSIWNPSTQERLKLAGGKIFDMWAFGLGYDSTADDYKAVVILGCHDTRVYSLKSDKWRSIMKCPCDESVLQGPYGPGVFASGALNWITLGRMCENKIVALDLGTEKYSVLQMPSRKTREGRMLLSVLGERLALCDTSSSYLDVWVMKKKKKVCGDKGDSSWFKLFSINKEPNVCLWSGYLWPVAFVVKEKLLLVFLQDGEKGFFLFDVETKSLKCVGIDSYAVGRDPQLMFVGNNNSNVRLHANCRNRKRARKIATTTKKTTMVVFFYKR